jgi:hypothetical protein
MAGLHPELEQLTTASPGSTHGTADDLAGGIACERGQGFDIGQRRHRVVVKFKPRVFTTRRLASVGRRRLRRKVCRYSL